MLTEYSKEVTLLTEFNAEIAKSTLEKVTASLNIGTGKILQALRVSITGQGSGPDLMLTMEIIGKEETCNRIN